MGSHSAPGYPRDDRCGRCCPSQCWRRRVGRRSWIFPGRTGQTGQTGRTGQNGPDGPDGQAGRAGRADAGRRGGTRSAVSRVRPQGLGGGHGGVGGARILQQCPGHRGRHDPAVPALRVDHPQLQMAARAHRWEQRGQVIGEIVDRGRPFTAQFAAQPAAEGQPARRDPGRPAVPADQHELGVQRVGRVRVTRVAVVGRGEGAAWVEVSPDLLTGRPPARGASPPQRRVGERGHQHRSDVVSEAPAPAVAALHRGFLSGIEADLHRCGVAHHLAAPGAGAVEEFFHGRVARQVQHADGPANRVVAVALQGQARAPDGLAQRGHLATDGRHALAEAVGGGGA